MRCCPRCRNAAQLHPSTEQAAARKIQMWRRLVPEVSGRKLRGKYIGQGCAWRRETILARRGGGGLDSSQSTITLYGQQFSGHTSFVANNNLWINPAPEIWMQLAYDGTTYLVLLSPDGQNFLPNFSFTGTSVFTAAANQAGFGFNILDANRTLGMLMLHWAGIWSMLQSRSRPKLRVFLSLAWQQRLARCRNSNRPSSTEDHPYPVRRELAPLRHAIPDIEIRFALTPCERPVVYQSP